MHGKCNRMGKGLGLGFSLYAVAFPLPGPLRHPLWTLERDSWQVLEALQEGREGQREAVEVQVRD